MDSRFAAACPTPARAPATADVDARVALRPPPASRAPDTSTPICTRPGMPPCTPATLPGHARGPGLAELLGALSHALDLTGGPQPGHAVRSCWIAQQVGHALGLARRSCATCTTPCC
jgi:hypothetical protein